MENDKVNLPSKNSVENEKSCLASLQRPTRTPVMRKKEKKMADTVHEKINSL